MLRPEEVTVTVSTALDRGRSAYAERRWLDASSEFALAVQQGGLPAEDLERSATAALLLGRFDDGINALAKAHEEYLLVGDAPAAARCAAWLAMQLRNAGKQAAAGGWFARARRLVEEHPEPSAVEGFLLVQQALGQMYGRDFEGARQVFARAEQIAERFQDRDVLALSRLGQGQALIRLERLDEGMVLLDEVLASVMSGGVGPFPSGIVYCALIESCHLAFDLGRAQEWTVALDRWCSSQKDLVPFQGQCRMHRAEIYCLQGAWSDALATARTAQELSRRGDRNAMYGGFYQQAEVQRLRGEFAEAEDSYRQAHQAGHDPQPGLSLLRLVQGKPAAAQSLIRRAAGEADNTFSRRMLLPALVEIEVAAGDLAAARTAAAELESLAEATRMPWVMALAGYSAGILMLATGDPQGAAKSLRSALGNWSRLEAPYEAARCQVKLGVALQELGDDESAQLEFAAARTVFNDLGAIPALNSLDQLENPVSPAPMASAGLLSPREAEVLRLISAGMSNRSIASALFLSEKTVARHVSNILLKLDVPSRSAATAYAYNHGLAGRLPGST
jgi:DNA-binding CsgD family transcriptional regulator